MANKKSDVKAKEAYVEFLLNNGFDEAKVVSSPADIRAEKSGIEWFFEIKMTRRDDTYFGAATLTEWEQAFNDPDHFRFVVVQMDDDDNVLRFIEYTPHDFMQFSTIPPFKIFFSLPMCGEKKKSTRESKSLHLSEENFEELLALYKKLKKQQ